MTASAPEAVPAAALDTLRVAQWFVARGVSVIPIDHPATSTETDAARIGKVPALSSWSAYQERLPTDAELVAWFLPDRPRNLAIVTGALSGLVVVDEDSSQARAWADAHLPETPWMTGTAKGRHRFYRHPGSPVRNKARVQTPDGRIELDVRGDGGFVVAPTSMHQSGLRYQKLGDWGVPVDRLPMFDPAWFEAPAAPVASPVPPTRFAPRTDADHLRERARAYLRRMGGAVQGQGGDNKTLDAACRLVRGFALDRATALELLREWNTTCVPPWSTEELDAKISHAEQYGTEAYGSYRDQPPPPRAAVVSFPAAATPATRRPAVEPDAFSYTDAGNAEAFAARYGDRVRYDHRRGRWLIFDGCRWAPDADGQIMRLALAAVRARQQEAFALPDEPRAKALKHALASESRSKLDALVALARSQTPIADSGEHWDADPWLLGTPSGVVDLRTGAWRAGTPDDRITMQTAAGYDPEAACPRFERFIVEIFGGDPDLIDFTHRAIGYSLTGLTTMQALFLGYGTGGNGKSTLLDTLRDLLGDYAYNLPFSTLEMQSRTAGTNDVAALAGKRFVVASETNDGARLNEARIKALTGSDPITARFLYSENFTFVPVAKFWLAVNHKPVVRDDSRGFWRRMRLLPFSQTFGIDPHLADTLRREGPGILAWAVRGCLEWQQRGLTPPDVVAAATADYQADSDQLAAFLHTATLPDAEARIRGAALYEHYVGWAASERLGDRERLSATAFGKKMKERFTSLKDKSGVTYLGLAVKGYAS